MLKVINLIETFQNQHKTQTSEIKELNSEVMDKDEEIERLKKVIIMQERIRDKMQKQFHGNIERGVDKWLHCTLDEEIDAGMNSREIETIISAREQMASE